MSLRQILLHFINSSPTYVHVPYLLQDRSARKQPLPIEMQAGSVIYYRLHTHINFQIIFIIA